ncbi:hypothetical protein [Bradyrhizobium sp. 5.13L]
MTAAQNITEFLNIGLDIRGSASDVEAFLRSIESAVSVLRHDGEQASVELITDFGSLEEAALGMIEIIGTLVAKDAWGRLHCLRTARKFWVLSDRCSDEPGAMSLHPDLIAL